GCGIAPEELPTAFLRHATSKLRREEDLAAIGTLGFRGEALAAISAVSRVEILTRTAGAQHGAVLRLEGGVAGQVETAGAPEGTTIAVRDLFYNTPARLKFMRKDSAETAAVAGLMQHLALSHPDVSFKFLKDGVEALHTPGDGKLDSAIYAALGRDFARGLVPVRGRSGDVAVDGFVTAPLQGRGSRSMQVFFVNGRFIKSQLLTAALEEGYRNQIMKGKFPGCVLAVTVPVTAVDVNVHPAKTQVKFAREKEVFDTVYHTVLDALDAFGGAVPAPEKAVRETVNPRQDFFQTMDAKTYRTARRQPSRPRRPRHRLPVLPGTRSGRRAPGWPTAEQRPVHPLPGRHWAARRSRSVRLPGKRRLRKSRWSKEDRLLRLRSRSVRRSRRLPSRRSVLCRTAPDSPLKRRIWRPRRRRNSRDLPGRRPGPLSRPFPTGIRCRASRPWPGRPPGALPERCCIPILSVRAPTGVCGSSISTPPTSG
ncbi:DNA mismatch repair endonuclease MutL, partial [Dysosmobacter sp.]|uniref:DNA mismatch repair endonuclease MutL n=1 Tax=Dysosmobacter sp. TaxID=2591382 RepID=UPI003D94C8AD